MGIWVYFMIVIFILNLFPIYHRKSGLFHYKHHNFMHIAEKNVSVPLLIFIQIWYVGFTPSKNLYIYIKLSFLCNTFIRRTSGLYLWKFIWFVTNWIVSLCSGWKWSILFFAGALFNGGKKSFLAFAEIVALRAINQD